VTYQVTCRAATCGCLCLEPRKFPCVTSMLNTYNGHRHIGGPSTTHRRLAPLPKEPSRISLMCLIFLETRIIHLHFPTDSLCLSLFNFFLVGAATSRKTFVFLKEGRFGRSRSSKVDKFGANRKRGSTSYYFVIVTLVLSCTVSEI